ncbi:relaxase/mobilization nuclease domain-containing protein [Fibrella sp. HMF5335]|uniref:Relaxase/mobilization nuclease domain-containing protein n=1 Tax=Fibrella rubiginis TaxID=2817060 RepID=A0A939K484_9BACT|nr:relaxase/mobilization nuclease domain-containing protein [Fibrella rubiginis]MBO0936428.1 relaxase/mobilization nuclease domain-containing protein [Fibrella rubiginis]
MVVRLLTGKNIAGALQYNEQKVTTGEAQRLAAGNFPDPQTALWSWQAKREMFEFLAHKNPRVEKPTVHISLAFHPKEQLSNEQLCRITQAFLDEAGYEKQPYMLYRHQDTAHPHVHILTVCVDRNGQKISDTYSKNRMNTIRQRLEVRFGLVQAEQMQPRLERRPDIADSQGEPLSRLGQSEARVAIDTTLHRIMSEYACSSFDDLTCLLTAYHIQARRINRKVSGREAIGVTFRLTNGEKAISPAIKASKLISKPTFNRLQEVFTRGQATKAGAKASIYNILQRELTAFKTVSEPDFYTTLRQAGVHVLDDGHNYLYVDHRNKIIWNEAELGAAYSRAVLQSAFTVSTERLRISLGTEEGKLLGQRVAEQYKLYRQETGLPHESQLIEAFPFTQLIQRLRSQGVPADQAVVALQQFEKYKLGQLPVIRMREETQFQRYATGHLELASQLTLSVAGRITYLRSMDLLLTDQGLQHAHNSSFSLPLPAERRMALLTSTYNQRISFGSMQSMAEKELLIQLAEGEGRGSEKICGTDLSRLQKILPIRLWNQVGRLFNQAQAEQAGEMKEAVQQTLLAWYQQGIVVWPEGGTYRVGHYLTDPTTYATLPQETADRLRAISYDHEQALRYQTALTTVQGRLMAVLADSIAKESRNEVDVANRLIDLINQKTFPSFADETALLNHLTQASLSNVNNKRLANTSTQQPNEVTKAVVKQESRLTEGPPAKSDEDPNLTEGVSRGIRRN